MTTATAKSYGFVRLLATYQQGQFHKKEKQPCRSGCFPKAGLGLAALAATRAKLYYAGNADEYRPADSNRLRANDVHITKQEQESEQDN